MDHGFVASGAGAGIERRSALRMARRGIPLRLLFLAGMLLMLPQCSAAAERPRLFVDTDYELPVGEIIEVPAGGDLQSALYTANPGDVIELEAGAAYVGNFILPAKPGSGWIHIRSSRYRELPSAGLRVAPPNAGLMPKIVTPNGMPAITAAEGAHHFRFVGVEVRPADGLFVSNLVMLGSGVETDEADLPHHIIFDRSYIRGDPEAGSRRGVALNGIHLAVIDSYLSDFMDLYTDSQAIAGWNGPGPFRIVNNYLEAAGENVLFGGGDPRIPELVPSDIEIRNNHFFKPLSWKIDDPSYEGIPWLVKNLFELKNARRVLVTGNVFEHNWPHGQNGFGILFTVRNQGGTAPWSVVEDVAFARNIVGHMNSGINILGYDNNFPSQQTKRIVIRNNLFEDINGVKWGGIGGGRLFQILSGAAAITIEHNTAFQDGPIIVGDGAPSSGLIYRSNITMEGSGVLGSGTAVGIDTLNTYFPDAVFSANVQIGGKAAQYPPGNFFPKTIDEVDFTDWSNGEYRLDESSPYKNTGWQGKDAGADFNPLEAATMGALNGKTPVRFEADDPSVRCSPCAWYRVERPMFSAGGIISGATAGASVAFDFSGTAVKWIGQRSEWSGIANVYVNGAFRGTVDAYASPERAQEVLFSMDGLAEGSHRILIEVTGAHNANSGGPWISVDAFDVTDESGVVRVEEEDASMYCSPCAWNPIESSLLSAGEALGAIEPGAYVIFDFEGTGASWIGYRDGWSGVARVYLDGVFQRDVDTYGPFDEPQAVLFTTSGLGPGLHRLAIQVSGDRNPDSKSSWITVDAFEALP